MASLSPTPDEALAFAIMVDAGMPSTEAIRYFLNEEELESVQATTTLHNRWVRSAAFKSAILKVQGKSWEKMTLDERVKFAVNKVYTEMAYYLYSHNYSVLDGASKNKADTCREALERRLAGTAGKLSGLDEWYKDVLNKKVTLPPADQTGLKIIAPIAAN